MTSLTKKLETQAHLMGRMIDRCGVDIERLAADRLGQTLASAVRACSQCSSTKSCQNWLDATAGETHLNPPAFCPNATRFELSRSR
ncbi:DUF6455 family protein [Nitratireductor sp. ZSWI3]|uniref:DUF6455 family protein n=1 Tax=Nitratireductor sp. ZSWI3 TaxID=2966359 RepID=UPI00215003DF|nr:DUF6455 family protein [Nitratireductor sp. ZSWI3]MCR4269058.1 DUF6455 family protein [Nitratireductor sp. ZSWI3]